MIGQAQYNKLTKQWENYVMGDVLDDLLRTFPTTQGMTIEKVAKVLVQNEWIEKLQRYVWRASESDVPFEEYKVALVKYSYGGVDDINAWGNSYERKVAQRWTKRMKKHTRILNQRLSKLDKTDDVVYIRALFNTIEKPTKKMKKAMRRLESGGVGLEEMKRSITKDITSNQYKAVMKESTDKVNNFQGKRVAQDQLQVVNNTKNDEMVKEIKGEPQVIAVGIWSLSSTHNKHATNDPCERFDSIKTFFSDEGDIPSPVVDTHHGCKCSMRLKIIDKDKKDDYK